MVLALVVLERNISPELGLANGSTGVVKEIVYDEEKPPPDNVPKLVWIEIFDYTGPSFFPQENEARKKWVPISPVTANDYCTGTPLSRIMSPIKLAWAWTIWKAQGQTIRGKVILHLGDTEKDHGLSYVGFSRATTLRNVGIEGGITGERLTTRISSLAKLRKRLQEDARLKILEQTTMDKLNSTRNNDNVG